MNQSKEMKTITLKEIANQLGMTKNEIYSLIQLLIKENHIVQINRDFYLHHNNWEDLLNFLKKHFKSKNEIEVSHLKEFVKTTRKFVIPLFEFLDSKDITRRKENYRVQGNAI